MSEILQPKSLDSSKLEKFEPTKMYASALIDTLETYQIPESAFENNPIDVIQGTIRLVQKYQVSSEFFKDSEKSLFAIAIADSWLSAKKIKEKRSLLDVLKLVTTGFDKKNEYVTFSGRVTQLAQKNLDRGKYFDPDSEVEWEETVAPLDQYLTEFTNLSESAALSEKLSRWTQDSILHKIRGKLGITKETEKVFKTIVLDKTTDELFTEMKFAAMFDGDLNVAIFPQDYITNFLQHEYSHYQSEGIQIGHYYLLFNGLNEAITESMVDEQVDYMEQTRVLSFLENNIPHFSQIAIEAYMGRDKQNQKMLHHLVLKFGLQGMLAISRLHSDNKYRNSNFVEESVYLTADEVLEKLNEHVIK